MDMEKENDHMEEVTNNEQKVVDIPKVEYPGEDKLLLRRVHKFKTGFLRILIFTIVGMVLGWFSIGYYTDSFIVTKVILAIPYKISEAIYVNFIGTGVIADNMIIPSHRMNEFFQQSYLATFFAERITPLLIGGAMYGCLGYFTGDKKVFTLNRFIKFVATWAVTILLFIGAVYGVNAKAIHDNSHLKNLTAMFLENEHHGTRIDGAEFEPLKAAFLQGIKRKDDIKRNTEQEHPFVLIFGETRDMICYANWEDGYVCSENNDRFAVSEKFMEYLKAFYESDVYLGTSNTKRIETEDNEDE